MNIAEEVTYKDEDFSKQENLKTGKSSPNIYGMLEDSTKFDFIVNKLRGKLGTIEYKICGINFYNHTFLLLLILIGDENIKSYIYIFYIHIVIKYCNKLLATQITN